MFELIKEEPVAFQALVQAALAVVAGFGWMPGLTQETMGLLLGFSAAALAFVTRGVVSPTLRTPPDAT
jgi:hypothetical protein